MPNGSEPQPDLAIVQPLDTVYLEHHPDPVNIFWLVEYSYSTLNYDLGDKQIVYAQSEIPEYRVVNLKDLQLTVFQDPSPSGYRSVTNIQDGTISPLAFPNISIEVRRLFEVNRSS